MIFIFDPSRCRDSWTFNPAFSEVRSKDIVMLRVFCCLVLIVNVFWVFVGMSLMCIYCVVFWKLIINKKTMFLCFFTPERFTKHQTKVCNGCVLKNNSLQALKLLIRTEQNLTSKHSHKHTSNHYFTSTQTYLML